MNFSIFTVFLKNRNIISKMKRSNVTDYAALNNDGDPLFVVFGSSTKNKIWTRTCRLTVTFRGLLCSKFSFEGAHHRLNGPKFSFTTTRERSHKT